MMKLLKYIFAALLCVNVGGCGVTSKDKEDMQNSLYVTLTDSLAHNGIEVGGLNIELKKVKDEPYPGTDNGYWATFSCSFNGNGESVYMVGDVGFDENGFVAQIPERNGKIAVRVSVANVGGKPAQISECRYVLPCFMN